MPKLTILEYGQRLDPSLGITFNYIRYRVEGEDFDRQTQIEVVKALLGRLLRGLQNQYPGYTIEYAEGLTPIPPTYIYELYEEITAPKLLTPKVITIAMLEFADDLTPAEIASIEATTRKKLRKVL